MTQPQVEADRVVESAEPDARQDAAPAVEVIDVSLSFQPGVPVLDGVTLEVRARERLCLLGPSGSGKTTLLHLIAGFLTPSTGTIRILGENQTRVPTHRRNIGIVFQEHALFPHMSVGDNVAFGLNCRSLQKREVRNRVAEVLDLVELGHLTTRRPRQLSGGQRQRVAVARALAVRPGVLLMDEPFSSLDTKLRRGIREEVVTLQEKLLIPTVLVTHDQEEALAFGHRIAVLNAGRVEQIGTPKEVYEFPSTRFVASFVGDANFVDVEIRHTTADGRLLGLTIDGQLLEAHSDEPVAIGTRGSVLLRPEWLTVTAESTASAHAASTGTSLQAVVRRITYLGEKTDCVLETGDAMLVASLPVDLVHLSGAVDEPVRITWGDRQPWFYPEPSGAVAP